MKLSRNDYFHFNTNIYFATLWQIASALFFLWLMRVLFVLANQSSVDVDSFGECLRLGFYGLRFDLTATAYFNALFILMRIVPFRFAGSRLYLKITDWVYYLTNSLMLVTCLGDMVYYRFSGTRMRWSGLQEIAADTNIGGIIGQYMLAYWWILPLAALTIAMLVWIYKRPVIVDMKLHGRRAAGIRVTAFIVLAGMTFLAMRGRAGSGNPLNIADATWGARSARQINVVLNTPFTLLRSIGKGAGVERLTFFSEARLAELRSSVHRGIAGEFKRKNVMIIILEGGGSIFMDSLNRFDDGKGELRGLMPFTDSIISRSLVFDRMMATGRSSNGGANAILSSFPAFEPFSYMLSPYNATPFDSPATLLKREGYHSAFYYGCNHGSFNIDQLAHASGFDRVVDRAAYPEPDRDYDHAWGIYDRPMAQFVVKDLSALEQPWIASWFTISAHTPNKMPDTESLDGYRYKEASPQRGMEYTDRCLRQLFYQARECGWYENTIFVITADHGNRDFKAGSHYDTPYIRYHVPFIVFTPDGSIAPRRVGDRVVSQFDIAPTLMSLLGYPHDYIAVGTDQTAQDARSYGISFIDNRFMITSPERVVFTDSRASAIEAVYDAVNDPELTSPLTAATAGDEPSAMLLWAQALLQDYTGRINTAGLALAH